MTRQKNEKYYLILEGAFKTFAETGFHNTQVSKIAKAAGVADGTIYLYFKRKEDILIALFQEKLGELVNDIHARLDGVENPSEAILKICEAYYELLDNNIDLAYITHIELRQSNMELRQEIGQCLKPFLQIIDDWLNKGIELGTFRRDINVKLIKHLIFGGMDEVVSSWLVAGRKFSLSEQASGTAQFYLKGLQ